MRRPKVSIVIPLYKMQNHAELLWRCIHSVMEQTFTDYEIVLTEQGTMPENTNAGIKRANGWLIKILYMDDYFAHKDALKEIVEAFKGHWMIHGVDDNPYPYWTDDILEGNNKLGSPTALTLLNDKPLLFDEKMTWLLDCDYYQRLYDKFGEPTILDKVCVIMGIHEGQKSHTMSDEEKQKEHEYIREKYV